MRHLLLLIAAALPAAERKPLGLVERVDGNHVIAAMPGATLTPGSMVAIHGPGAVTRHPLTNEIITEERVLVAKAQFIGTDGSALRLRVRWQKDGAAIAPGMDVIPLPGEAAPNAPPMLTATIAPVTTPVQSTVAIRVPVEDPDGDALLFTWRLDGPAGRCGALDAPTTTRPMLRWAAPAAAVQATLLGTARDALGQELAIRVPLVVQAAEPTAQRELKPIAQLGRSEPKPARLLRAPDGAWLALDDAGAVFRYGADWLDAQPLPLAGLRRASALAARGDEVYALDPDQRQVRVVGADGVQRRTYGPLGRPSDLAVGDDGTVFVADQELGGVAVFEPAGAFRGVLGRSGADGFAQLTRICLTADGGLCALDAGSRRVVRFDRWQRRLDDWQVQGGRDAEPVDLVAHPRGLMTLLANGTVLLFSPKGIPGDALPATDAALLGREPGAATGLAADRDGRLLICHPARGVVARLEADGRPAGLRGGALRAQPRWAADGTGALWAIATDERSLLRTDAQGWALVRGSIERAELRALAVASDGSAAWAFDGRQQALLRFAPELGKPLVIGQKGTNKGQFQDGRDVATDDQGRVAVIDAGLRRITVFDRDGKLVAACGERGSNPGQLEDPVLLALSPDGASAYVYDEDSYEVRKFALDYASGGGRQVAAVGGKGSGPAQFRTPVTLGCDRQGLLYVIDRSRGDIQVLDFRGNNAVVLHTRTLAEAGLEGARAGAVSPDGRVWLGDGTDLATASW